MKGRGGFSQFIPLDLLGGLAPRAWVAVGRGFSREEVKEVILRSGRGFVSGAVLNLEELAAAVLARSPQEHEPGPPAHGPSPVLGPFARQEILRAILSDRRVSARMPELKRLRRQSGFFKKLDRSIQAGRMVASHEDEEEVLEARLLERMGPSPLRAEIRLLTRAFSGWLEGVGCMDPPLLLARAAAALAAGEVPGLPQEILHFTAAVPESAEKAFWEALEKQVAVRVAGPLAVPVEPGGTGRVSWERWHTLDDAAERLADALAAESVDAGPANWSRSGILIPDSPDVRRSLVRALARRGIPLADPRDPTRLRWDEQIKTALQPLGLVARGFDRQDVIAWLRAGALAGTVDEMIAEIRVRGIRSRRDSYAGGKLAPLHERLERLERELGGSRTCRDAGRAHLGFLEREASALGLAPGTIAFFAALWEAFAQDLERTQLGDRRAPPLYWSSRLRERLEEMPAPVERLKPRGGVGVYRLGQSPVESPPRLWIFGLHPQWLSAGGDGDYWYSERDREILGPEFGVRSSMVARRERIQSLRAWLGSADSTVLLDAEYSWDGRERETIEPLLRELGLNPEPEGLSCEKCGAHPRWTPSFGALRPVQPQSLKLPPLAGPGEMPEINASVLDRYGRCPFQALGSGRWRVRDQREPDAELWPDIRGNILHAAVKLLLEARDQDGNFTLSIDDALARAWETARPRGLLRGERNRRYELQRLRQVLEVFCEEERAYVKRSAARVLHLEGPELRMDLDGVMVKGIPDRIDGHPDGGLFVMDYKTSGQLAKGLEMVEDGYRLQLPFYALAASQLLRQPALGVQFIELGRQGGRGSGIFFKRYNGKEPGKLTNSRSKLSVLEMDPDEAWSRCRGHAARQARAYSQGEFSATPAKETECRSCPFADLCGRRRAGPS